MKRRNFLGLLLAAPVAAVAAIRIPARPPSTGFFLAHTTPEAAEDIIDPSPYVDEIVQCWSPDLVTTLARNAARGTDYQIIRQIRNPFPAGRLPFKVIS